MDVKVVAAVAAAAAPLVVGPELRMSGHDKCRKQRFNCL
jgi:hypothetical protein